MSDLIQNDIEAYLHQHEQKDLLRFITCGSVDDGKSTLIGRLLHDTKMIYEDQLATLSRDSKTQGTQHGEMDLALLVDGLQSEREQGITIDVAYRYFSTDRRKFIIADTPGHEQYTRNMATGASTADLAILLIDARHGVQVQTRRHSFICSLLGIRHFVIAINKMDLVDYSQARFEEIQAQYLEFSKKLKVPDIQFVPMSALKGDFVVNRSEGMGWYTGQTLLELLDTLEIQKESSDIGFRFPVQYVNRPHLDFRGYCGTVAAGTLEVGDAVKVLPSGHAGTVKAIVKWEGEQQTTTAGEAVTLTLNEEIDISRGDMLVKLGDPLPEVGQYFSAHLVWMHQTPLMPGRAYDFKVGTTFTSGQVVRIVHQIEVNSLDEHAAATLPLNGIALCEVALSSPVAYDPYAQCRATGSFIVIDRLTNVTVGAGMIQGATEETQSPPQGTDWQAFEIEFNALIRKHFPHWEAKDVRTLFGG